MSRIENIKTYNGQVLDNIFFRPMLTGKSAEELGIRVMYNVPVPTVLHFWKRTGDVLKKFTSSGWSGGAPASKYQKTIPLSKVKAEMAYSADDYFSTVYELITGRADVNLDDLSGTELEEAETSLFRASIAEGIRATMWYGDLQRTSALNTFDGFIKNLMTQADSDRVPHFAYIPEKGSSQWAERLLKRLWEESEEQLRAVRSEGELAFFVTSDVYNAYEESLDSVAIESAYMAKQMGRERLYYRGIPVIDVQLNGYHEQIDNLPHSFALLADKRNLALAVNTNDFPGTEVRMWYNPDLMENRQRAIFMAGCEYLLPELVTFAIGVPAEKVEVGFDEENQVVSVKMQTTGSESWISELMATVYDQTGEPYVDCENVSKVEGGFAGDFEIDSFSHYTLEVVTSQHSAFKIL